MLQKLKSGATPYYSIAFLLLVLAYLLSAATNDSSRLNDLFLIIFGLGISTLILLTILLVRSLHRLYKNFKHNQAGSRLTMRLVTLFVLLILISTSIVYSFSIHFLHRGINSWFDVEIEQALNDSLELSKTTFDIRRRTLLRQSRMMAGTLSNLSEINLNYSLRELSDLSSAEEMSVWTLDGQLVAATIQNTKVIVPDKPNEAIFRQLRKQQDYISLDPADGDRLQLRAAVQIPSKIIGEDPQVLQVLFPIDEQLSVLAKTVQEAYTDYKELNYLRKPLITIFTLTLSLIVLLTVLASIWFAIWISKRIVHPLQELADGTQSVASGNYNTHLTTTGHDEIGFLVQSFNKMTQRLTKARDATQQSHQLLEQQTNYLSTVLSSLSSGVITLNDQHQLKTSNETSGRILGINLQSYIEKPLVELGKDHHHLIEFEQLISHEITNKQSGWQQQIELLLEKRSLTLICRGTPLPDNAGWVIVFDDITALIRAQRDAAWAEVARRLAHEIKNPLTPIQLSAERLQVKYHPLLPEDQTGLLNKLTNTIIQQVEAMKDMVNDFSDYAKNSELQVRPYPIGTLINEIITLYRSNREHKIRLLSTLDNIKVELDVTRFRQVLHNLIKNAIEACEDANMPVKIDVDYQLIQQKDSAEDMLELTVRDYGPGIPDEMVNILFEPYATNKVRGTGLGLAIVKKIIDEHQGTIWVENKQPGGASIQISLPITRASL